MISSDKTMKKTNIINDDDEAADDNLIEIIVILECQLKQKQQQQSVVFWIKNFLISQKNNFRSDMMIPTLFFLLLQLRQKLLQNIKSKNQSKVNKKIL